MLFAIAEQRLDHFADHLAGGVARMPRSASVNTALPLGAFACLGVVFVGILRHVRGDVDLAAGGHEISGVEVLVRTDALALFGGQTAQHLERRLMFRSAARQRQPGIERQFAAVLHQHVAQVGWNRFLLVRLGKQLGIRIGGAGVGLVAALLSLEVDLRIGAAARVGRRRTVLGHEALVRGPGADQRAVDAEMLVGKQLRRLGLLHHLPEQGAHHFMLDQPIPILGIGAVIPRRIVHAQADKPAVEHVVAQLLAQQSLAADTVQRLQHEPAQQPFRWHRIATPLLVDRLEQQIHVAQRPIKELPDRHQGVVRRHVVRGLTSHKQAFLRHVCSAHRSDLAGSPMKTFFRTIDKSHAFTRRISTNC